MCVYANTLGFPSKSSFTCAPLAMQSRLYIVRAHHRCLPCLDLNQWFSSEVLDMVSKDRISLSLQRKQQRHLEAILIVALLIVQ